MQAVYYSQIPPKGQRWNPKNNRRGHKGCQTMMGNSVWEGDTGPRHRREHCAMALLEFHSPGKFFISDHALQVPGLRNEEVQERTQGSVCPQKPATGTG